MQRPDFWFNVVPAIIVIPLCLFFFFAYARFIPSALRRRDRGMIAGLVGGYVIIGGYLFVAIETIRSAQII